MLLSLQLRAQQILKTVILVQLATEPTATWLNKFKKTVLVQLATEPPAT
jgi:hypothetical protein